MVSAGGEFVDGAGGGGSRDGRRYVVVKQSLKSAGRDLWLPLTILLAGVLFQRLAALTPWLTERLYARSVYPQLVAGLSSFSRPFSFSVGEALAFLLLAAALACVARFCALLFLRRGGASWRLWAAVKLGSWLGALLLWSFLFSFGLLYQRPPLFELLGYERRQADASELEELGGEIVRGINENYLEARAEGRAAPGAEEVAALLRESYDSAADLAHLPRGPFAAPKPVYSSGLLTRLGISGVYSPWTGEPNYNADLPDFQLPFAMAHEMAHQRGVARESEANFVAYLACVNSRDPLVRYSGYRGGLGVLAELYMLEPEKAKALLRQLGPGFREDSRRAARFWAKAAGPLGSFSYQLNDLYLRANRVRAGAADYAGSTALIIGHHLREKSRGRPAAQGR